MARPKKTIESNQPSDEIENAQVESTDEAAIEEIAAAELKLAQLRKNVKYNFQKQSQKIHSLYKLGLAKFKKNVSWTTTPEWTDVDHVHFFHSIDSAGNVQDECVPIGGHFHKMLLVKAATETEPAVYRTSGPLKRVRQKNPEGYFEVVEVPAIAHDHHTHEVTYMHSEIWSPAKINEEFVKYQQTQARQIVQSEKFVEQ